ncbi:MAG: hypothetical protein N3F07_02415 [Candidatus Micrarchaeota archaeon]|nr:hypothetical protein [Candidatus Micrarchaeota archaeon]
MERSHVSGQAAVEMLVFVAFVLLFIIPLALLFLSMSGEEAGKSSLEQARIAARIISDEAGEVYLQGPGSKKSITVNYPSGVADGAVEGGLVVLTMDVGGRRTDVASPAFANITGNLSGRRNAGPQRIDLFYNHSLGAVVVRYG